MDYDTEASSVLLEHPITSLEGIGCCIIDHVIYWSRDLLVFSESIQDVEHELIEQDNNNLVSCNKCSSIRSGDLWYVEL